MAPRKRPSSPPVRLRRVSRPSHFWIHSSAHPHSKHVVTIAGVTILFLLVAFFVKTRHYESASCWKCINGSGELQDLESQEPVAPAEEEEEQVVAAVQQHEVCVRLYHEQQQARFDLLHALNNLLQGRHAFCRRELDTIAEHLGTAPFLSFIFKKHYNVFTGNYDMKVLYAALTSRGKEIHIFHQGQSIHQLDLPSHGDRLIGLIVHEKHRHWIALRQIEGAWYNLNSKYPVPLVFCNREKDLHNFLAQVLQEGGEIVLVLDPCEKDTAVNSERSGYFTNLWNLLFA